MYLHPRHLFGADLAREARHETTYCNASLTQREEEWAERRRSGAFQP